MGMKVAVIMPAYNAEKFITDALNSLLRQRDDANLDIIVVNDGSTDGTAEILRTISAQAPELRVIEQANAGIARTRNVALAALTPDTDLVTFLDADDMSPAGRFKRDVPAFEADPALEMHYSSIRAFRGDTPGYIDLPEGTLFADARAVQLGGLLARTDFIRRVGTFDDQFTIGDDTDFIFRAFGLQPKLILSDDVSVYYRRHGTNITRDTATTSKDFSRAAVMATVRFRKGQMAAPPAGVFNAKEKFESLTWW
jgi:glycosyltransferase involved in cell wall biosynthesis